jgi:plasmid stabilization system protein ParE
VKRNASPGPHRVFLTERAVSDLLAIESYSIEEWGKKVAVMYLAKFEKAFKQIELNPGILLPNPMLSERLLFYRVEKHLMACVKIDQGIAVLTIIHATRELTTLIPELAPSLKDELLILLQRIDK